MLTLFIALGLGLGLFVALGLLWFGSEQWRRDRGIKKRRKRRHRH